MSKQRVSKSDKGCIGFVYGGVLKNSHIRLFKTSDKDPQETYDELTQHYGNVSGRYVLSADTDDVYEKMIKELTEHRINDTYLFSVACSTASETLRSTSGCSRCHLLNHKSDDTDGGNDSTNGDVNDEKVKTKSKSKTKSRDDEQDTKQTNVMSKAKSKTKSKSKSDEEEEETVVSETSGVSDNDSDEESDEETKKPKLKKKSKSASKDDETDKPKKSKAKSK